MTARAALKALDESIVQFVTHGTSAEVEYRGRSYRARAVRPGEERLLKVVDWPEVSGWPSRFFYSIAFGAAIVRRHGRLTVIEDASPGKATGT